MVNMRQALGVDDFNQMSNYTGQLQNKRRSVGQKDYGLGGKALDMAAALGDAYNQYQPPETALGIMALPAKAVYGLGNMIVQDVGDKTKSIMGTDINNPAAMNQAATDAFGLAADTMAGGGVVSRMTDMPTGAVLGANVFQGGPHKYGPEGAAESLKHMGKGEGAQAYGWGRYDAENKVVGQEYFDNLGGNAVVRDGKTEDRAAYLALLQDKIMDGTKASREDAYQAAKDVVDQNLSVGDVEGMDLEIVYRKAIELNDATQSQGYLYKHDLPDEDIARYLDWDAPLSEQPENVQRVLKEKLTDNFAKTDPSGQDMYTAIMEESESLDFPVNANLSGRQSVRNNAQQAASEALGKAGIPGLKYFDGMSRYIDPEDAATKIPILEKYEAAKAAWEAAGSKGLGQEASKFRGAQSRAQQQYPGGAIPTSKSVKELAAKKRTRNFVTWDQDVLNRMKLLERNNEDMTKALMPK